MKRLSITMLLLATACDAGSAGPTKYEDMDFEQRRAFMTDVVLPEMTEVFVAFDPKFKGMTCATCHGEGASDGTYAMPSSQIPPLPASEEAFLEYNKDPEHARWSQFMVDEVWPEMAELLQVEVFDPKTRPEGFSCSNCHTHDENL
jgi:hypothetical protein